MTLIFFCVQEQKNAWYTVGDENWTRKEIFKVFIKA